MLSELQTNRLIYTAFLLSIALMAMSNALGLTGGYRQALPAAAFLIFALAATVVLIRDIRSKTDSEGRAEIDNQMNILVLFAVNGLFSTFKAYFLFQNRSDLLLMILHVLNIILFFLALLLLVIGSYRVFIESAGSAKSGSDASDVAAPPLE